MNSDTALEVLARADIDTLRKVSSIPDFWCRLRVLLSMSQFWYRRACHICGDRELTSQRSCSESEGSWCRTSLELEMCLDAVDPLFTSVQAKYSPLTIRVLLELGFSPLRDITAMIASTSTYPEALLVIIPSLDEEGARIVWPVILGVFRIRSESVTLNKLDILLRVGLYDRLSPEEKPLVSTRLSQRVTTLTDAIREGLLEVVKHCLQLPSVKPYGFNLRDAVSGGRLGITQVLLEDGRVDPREDSFKLVELLGQRPLEMLHLFHKDGRLNIAIGEAACCGNLPMFEELLPSHVTPEDLLHTLVTPVLDTGEGTPASYQSRFATVNPEARSAVIASILAHPNLTPSSFLYSEHIIEAIRPFIARRLVGAYRANSNPVAKGSRTLYTAFVRTLILKSLTSEEALDWLTANSSVCTSTLAIQSENARVIATAAASVVATGTPIETIATALGVHTTKTEEAFRGYFLSLAYRYDVERTRQMLRSEGCSKDGIKLALRLAGAQLGVREEPVPREYRVAFQALFGC